MKIKALGELVAIRVDLPEDVMQQKDGIQNPSVQRQCVTPRSTGVVVSIGDGFDLDWDKLPLDEKYRAKFRFPSINVGDHVVFSRYATSGQVVELVDEGVEHILLPGIALVAIIEEE